VQRIPCFILCWMDYNGIKRLTNVIEHHPQLQAIIVENRSRFSDSIIRPYLISKVKQGVVHKYYFFEKNIGGCAFSKIRSQHQGLIRESEYVITTDGDIVPVGDTWLRNQIAILEKHKKVHAVSHNLMLHNLPWEHAAWLGSLIEQNELSAKVGEDYIEFDSGHHMTMCRGPEYARYLDWVGYKQSDSTHREFARNNGQKWVKMKEQTAVNYGWYLNHPDEPYFHIRRTQRPQHIFLAQRSCPYWVYEGDKEELVDLPYEGGSVFGNEHGE